MNYSLNNGLYCTKHAHSHLLFGQHLNGTENNELCTHFLQLPGLKKSQNSLCLMNFRCELTPMDPITNAICSTIYWDCIDDYVNHFSTVIAVVGPMASVNVLSLYSTTNYLANSSCNSSCLNSHRN